jgi:hypothetical protein
VWISGFSLVDFGFFFFFALPQFRFRVPDSRDAKLIIPCKIIIETVHRRLNLCAPRTCNILSAKIVNYHTLKAKCSAPKKKSWVLGRGPLHLYSLSGAEHRNDETITRIASSNASNHSFKLSARFGIRSDPQYIYCMNQGVENHQFLFLKLWLVVLVESAWSAVVNKEVVPASSTL